MTQRVSPSEPHHNKPQGSDAQSAQTVQSIVDFWRRRLALGGRCIVLCKDEAQSAQLASLFIKWQRQAGYLKHDPVWWDYAALSGERHLADEWLGMECDGLRLAVDDSLTANGLAAACGALRWGAVLLLYPGAAGGEFSQYLLRRAMQSEAVYQVESIALQASMADALKLLDESLLGPELEGATLPGWQHAAIEQQQSVVDRLGRLLTGHRHRPFLLTARRGRGKSTALGLAAARWCQSGANVVVVSPALSNIQTLIQRFEASGGERIKSNQWQLGAGRLQWQPMDRYLEAMQAQGRPPGDCLIIDEAAAFSFQQLSACLNHPRLAMATTLEGYEGSGRGFRLRFINWLSQQRPKWRKLELQLPMRWSQRDELEPALDDWLLLRASEQSAVDEASDDRQSQSVQTLCMDAAQRRDLSLATPLMGLLQQAHHRNSPNDFQALLEADDQQFWALLAGLEHSQEELQQRQLQAAAVLVEEPELDASLVEAIRLGRRRLPGQLLRQSLAFYCQNEVLSGLPGARIQRIATADKLRRRGCASQLLSAIEQQSRQRGLAWLGSSFPAEARLIRFWRHNGFQLIRLGLKPDRITGLPSAIVLKPLQPGLETECESLRQQYARRYFHGLQTQWQGMDADDAVALWPVQAAEPLSGNSSAESDWEMLKRFVEGSGELALWEVEIRSILAQRTLPPVQADARVLLAAIFQNRSPDSLGFSGQKALHDKLRQLLKQYYLEPAQAKGLASITN